MNIADYKAVMMATAKAIDVPPERICAERNETWHAWQAARGPFVFIGMYLIPIPRVPKVAEIMAAVADYYRLPLMEMSSERRAREVARPRQVAMYLCRRMTPRSLPDIGRRFGGRDHTTVMHAIRQISRLRLLDPELDTDINRLTARVSER